jgi:hypothetical protein
MSLYNQYTYPTGLPTQVDVSIPNIITTQDNSNYVVFEITDDIHNFEVIPTKIINRPWDNTSNTIKSIAIPLITSRSQEFDISNFTRRLFINQNNAYGTATGQKQHIKIDRPIVDGNPKKAYISNIIYAAYDFNDMLPWFDDDALPIKQDSSPVTVADLVVNNVFGTDKGFIIKTTATSGEQDTGTSGIHARQAGILRSQDYTTAHYPITRPIATMIERSNEVTAMERLGQAGLRSSIRGGLLPSDVFKNNFKLTIGGLTAANPTENATPNNILFRTGIDRNSYNNDNIIPAYNNEINIEIPDSVNWLTVDIAGVAWAHAIHWKEYGIGHVRNNIAMPLVDVITYVQMPVKVSLGIKFV